MKETVKYGEYNVIRTFSIYPLRNILMDLPEGYTLIGVVQDVFPGGRLDHQNPDANLGESLYSFAEGSRITIAPYNEPSDQFSITKYYDCCDNHESNIVFSSNLESLLIPYIECYMEEVK